jgi:hypothetical protein
MEHKVFENTRELDAFLSLYSISEVIISIDPVGRFHVWVNKFNVECAHCNHIVPGGKYCIWCGRDSP